MPKFTEILEVIPGQFAERDYYSNPQIDILRWEPVHNFGKYHLCTRLYLRDGREIIVKESNLEVERIFFEK